MTTIKQRMGASLMNKIKVLFIIKKRLSYGSYGISFGLINSAKFVAKTLEQVPGIEAKVVEVQDNNAIDKEVSQYKPTHVIIEALWVVPEKIEVLLKLHPKVTWFIRLHSKPEFIANEGIAFQWIGKYLDIKSDKLFISTNNKEFCDSLGKIYKNVVPFSPNIYPDVFRGVNNQKQNDRELNIGCFGALRPLKNHVSQALAAIAVAQNFNKKLKFHINNDRIEQRGDEVLKNLRAIFEAIPNAELVEHPWREHKDFIELVSQMDLGMQVSLTETFNIVAADFISVGIPVLVCKDIEFAPNVYIADPTSLPSIEKGITRLMALDNPLLTYWAKLSLVKFNEHATKQWIKILKETL
jgi:hypothetical protein